MESEFIFAFPPEVFPSIIERLRGTPARLADLLHSFSLSVLTKKSNEF